MCVEPTSTTALILGIASAASGAVGSIASYQASQQQYAGQMAAYEASQQAYNQQLQLNAEAANRAYIADQQRLKNEYEKAALDAQKLSVTALQAQGQVLASGRVGKSIGLLAQDAERSYGRDMATLGINLGYANEDYYLSSQQTFQQAKSANAAAAASRLPKPSAPSSLGLITGLTGSAVEGFSTMRKFTPSDKPLFKKK